MRCRGEERRHGRGRRLRANPSLDFWSDGSSPYLLAGDHTKALSFDRSWAIVSVTGLSCQLHPYSGIFPRRSPYAAPLGMLYVRWVPSKPRLTGANFSLLPPIAETYGGTVELGYSALPNQETV